MKTKKVILFIVEGISDKNSLALILSRLIRNENIQFHIVGGDITSNERTNTQNCINRVNDEIKKFLKAKSFRKTDIIKIIHLVDMDGAYIDSSAIKYGNTNKFMYNKDCIVFSNIEQVKSRNERKSKILDKLSTTNSISKIEYCMYYFSCNLEHVLHNEQNVEDELKNEYSDKFIEKYDGNENEFVQFLSNSEFTVHGDYKETWQYIKQGLNSLNRYCNLHLFFNDYYKN